MWVPEIIDLTDVVVLVDVNVDRRRGIRDEDLRSTPEDAIRHAGFEESGEKAVIHTSERDPNLYYGHMWLTHDQLVQLNLATKNQPCTVRKSTPYGTIVFDL